VGVSIFFSWATTTFVGRRLVIVRLSLYRFIGRSMGIIPAIADRASSDTDL
jgi:hypothetical protein